MTRFLLPLAISFTAACDPSPPPPPVDTDPVVDSSDTDPPDTDPVIDTFHTGLVEVVVLVRMPDETEYHRDTRSLRRIYWGANFRAWDDTCGGQGALGADGGCYVSPRWSSAFARDPWFIESRLLTEGLCSRLDDRPPFAIAPEDAWMTCCEGEGWGTTDCTDVPACCGSW